MRELLLLVKEFSVLEFGDGGCASHLIFHDVEVNIYKLHCSIFEAHIVPRPVSVKIEEEFDNQLSKVREVVEDQSPDVVLALCVVELLHCFHDENHDRYAIQVAEVVVVDASTLCPHLDQKCDLAENEQVLFGDLRLEFLDLPFQAED